MGSLFPLKPYHRLWGVSWINEPLQALSKSHMAYTRLNTIDWESGNTAPQIKLYLSDCRRDYRILKEFAWKV